MGLVTPPDATVLDTRRDAHDILHLNPATGATTTVGIVPNVENTDGEGGFLGLAISPGFATDHWLYIMHTSATDNRIVRIMLDGDVLQTGTEQILLSGILRNKFHNSGRLRSRSGRGLTWTGLENAHGTSTPSVRAMIRSAAAATAAL